MGSPTSSVRKLKSADSGITTFLSMMISNRCSSRLNRGTSHILRPPLVITLLVVGVPSRSQLFDIKLGILLLDRITEELFEIYCRVPYFIPLFIASSQVMLGGIPNVLSYPVDVSILVSPHSLGKRPALLHICVFCEFPCFKALPAAFLSLRRHWNLLRYSSSSTEMDIIQCAPLLHS